MAGLLATTSAESRACIDCHEKTATPVVVQQWATSRHAKNGVGCYECHQADQAKPGAFQHNGYSIAVLVTPKDCGQYHEQETAEFEGSHHAKAGQILGSLDNVLGEVAEGVPAANSGCKQCHGGAIRVLDAGKLTPTPFDEKFEWTYYELWHHEGRRARMGAAMIGPDYTQWHGFYEVAKAFYSEFLPQAEALLPGVTAEVKAMDDHKWLQGISPEEREKIQQFYQKRYGE